MSYTALYRKFRPASFADVKGQEHIVTTLKKSDRCRAYRPCLFVLRHKGYRKDYSGKDFGPGCEL